jgi:ribosomal protein RSM22 (predicted rRNA methylase)
MTAMIWQPINTAPKDGTTILIYEPGWPQPWRRIVAARWISAKERFESGDYAHRDATHWMPLPPITGTQS